MTLGLPTSKASFTVKFHVTLLVIFLRFEYDDERNCDNKQEISPEISLWQL
jgi:hypothetical protein